MIEQLDIESLKRQYKGGGTSAYHLKILLKVVQKESPGASPDVGVVK
jgi:hypothetical protein